MKPKIRFKNFKGNWEVEFLGNIFNITAGGDIDLKHVSEIKSDKFQYPIYANAEKKKGLYAYSDLFKIESGAITIAGRGVNIGIAHARNHPFYPIVRLLVLQPRLEADIFFFEYSINRIKLFVESTGVPQLTVPQISKCKIAFPTLPEQQKIAAFLSAVDEKIRQLKRKKELLEQYKKGMMQQLFSQKLRFKDDNGKDFPDWEEKRYGEVYSFFTTNSLSREKLNYESGSVKNIHYGDIHTKFASQFDIDRETVPFINSDVELSKIKNDCYCKEGDLVIADASEDYNDIGKAIEIVNLSSQKVVAGLHTFLARAKKNTMHIGFSGYLMQSNKVRLQVKRIAQGTKVLSLSTGRLSEIKINFPKIGEQQKIASFLSALDKKIELVSAQVDRAQQFKKGLLQQLFV